MTQLLRQENSGSGVVEYDASHSVWTQSNTSATFSVTGFRWIVLALGTGGSPILAAHDLGSTQSISNDYLALSVTESSYSAGVYPILRFKRTLA